MKTPIVSSHRPVLLIGGAEIGPDRLTEALKYGETVVCADGGANAALDAGLEPAAIIGDMDSVSVASLSAYRDVLYPIDEQDSTDFDKVLRSVEAPLYLGAGFLGDRFDHAVAALHVLLKYSDKPVILISDDDVVFLVPRALTLRLPVGTRVSLLPVMPCEVTTRGLKWDIDGQSMSMADFIGSSNEAAEDVISICAHEGLVVMLPPEALAAAVAALQDGALAG
ncbi:MAG: thiamine diphosphokinase [Pseudomonadota bacterium]